MILCTGGTGQLGRALQELAARRGVALTAVSRPDFDFADTFTLKTCLDAVHPALVVNAAAYTAVDAAEDNVEAAAIGNHSGPAQLAALCAAAGIPLIHVSTDYVFDGLKGAPYVETDPTSPTGVYGATKRDGEIAILEGPARAIILRTAWVYSATGKNFARTMLNAARRTTQLRVVADQRGTPTAAPDLAAAILDIAAIILGDGWHDAYRGIYHATGAGETTWYGFANAIFEEAATAGQPAPTITPIATADWPTPARRPPDSRLDGTKLQATFGVALPPWRGRVAPIVHDLLALDAPR